MNEVTNDSLFVQQAIRKEFEKLLSCVIAKGSGKNGEIGLVIQEQNIKNLGIELGADCIYIHLAHAIRVMSENHSRRPLGLHNKCAKVNEILEKAKRLLKEANDAEKDFFEKVALWIHWKIENESYFEDY